MKIKCSIANKRDEDCKIAQSCKVIVLVKVVVVLGVGLRDLMVILCADMYKFGYCFYKSRMRSNLFPVLVPTPQ